jgi:hypothetical protein
VRDMLAPDNPSARSCARCQSAMRVKALSAAVKLMPSAVLPSLPAVAVAVELQAERRPYGNPQGIRPSSGIVTVTGSGGEIAHGQQ